MTTNVHNNHTEYVVIWSSFSDEFIVTTLQRIGSSMDIKCIGTSDQCIAWIANQK